jgi:hypothetical protein
MLRIHLNDEQNIGWEFDDELIDFLDRSTAFLSNILITMKHNSMIKPITVNGATALPQDFVAFVGKLPIQILAGQAIPYGRIDNRIPQPVFEDPNLMKRTYAPTWKSVTESANEPSWESLTTNQTFNALYWSRLPYPSSFRDTDTLPYNIEFAGQIVDVARMMALNKNEYELTQDLALYSQIQAALGSVVKGDEQ